MILNHIIFQKGMNWDEYNKASLVTQTVKCLPTVRETWFDPWAKKIPWRRKWQPTPVFLPGESQGQQGLVGCRLWGCTESDTTSDLAAVAVKLLARLLWYVLAGILTWILKCKRKTQKSLGNFGSQWEENYEAVPPKVPFPRIKLLLWQ